MTYEKALEHQKKYYAKLTDFNRLCLYIISPYKLEDVIKFIAAINEKGINNVDVKDYSSDNKYSLRAFVYKRI